MSARSEGLGHPDIQGNSLIQPELVFTTIGEGHFFLGGVLYTIHDRLIPEDYNDGMIAERYLAMSADGDRPVCLSLLPSEAYATAKSYNTYRGWADCRDFIGEPERLIQLEAHERAAGTHYFPRLLSSLANVESGWPAFVIEYVPGVSVNHVDPEAIRLAAAKLKHAIDIGHQAGLDFNDLRMGDLRVMPDGEVMILDFNAAKPLLDSTRDNQIARDHTRLDSLLDIALREAQTRTQ